MTSIPLAIFSAFLLTVSINAYPTGAPKAVCKGPMIPHHHPHTPQPSATSPLTKFNTTWNLNNETISIDIQSKKPIKGLFLQARKMNGDEPLGTFIDLPSETHLVECPSGDALTHNSPQKWTDLRFTWKKPSSMKNEENIQFWATIVEDYEHFWVIKSVE